MLSIIIYLGWPVLALLPLRVDVFAELPLVRGMPLLSVVVEPGILEYRPFGHHLIPPEDFTGVVRKVPLLLLHL